MVEDSDHLGSHTVSLVTITYVSEEPTVFIFRVEESRKKFFLCPVTLKR